MGKERFKKREDVFDFIAESAIYGNLGLFVGAGLPMALFNNEMDRVALSWRELIEKCAKKLKIDTSELNEEGASYPAIASQLCRLYAANNGCDYETATKKLKETITALTSLYPDATKREEYRVYFDALEPAWIITTNYDLSIECILTGKGYSLSPNDQLIAPKDFIPIYHLHGIRTNPDSIIITQEDYISLFRPNQYRQQKLPLTIKESVTLLLGYNLGDFNVLTAVDWSRNVYAEQKINYPQGIIQFYFNNNNTKTKPYQDNNGITIVEFDDMSILLSELAVHVYDRKDKYSKDKKEIEETNEVLKNTSPSAVKKFIDDAEVRKEILELLKENNHHIISGFLELFSKAIDETWKRARPAKAFEAYNDNLRILLDVLEYLNIESMPPALIESVAYNLNSVAYYIGKDGGQSWSAYHTWENRKEQIPPEAVSELLNIANTQGYYHLKPLLKDI